jgi:AcrR family transcriptional regulator
MDIKEQILGATLELACEKGLGRVSMSQIAEKVGIKKSSLYSHYASKEEIIGKMYTFFREQAKKRNGADAVDYGDFVSGHTMKEILRSVVNSYQEMNADPQMEMFYKVITSERPYSKEAAEIMLAETKTMIQATKRLFYAMQVKEITHFDHPDRAAVSFAMTVHAIIEYQYDVKVAESAKAENFMEQYIEEFCTNYARKESKEL